MNEAGYGRPMADVIDIDLVRAVRRYGDATHDVSDMRVTWVRTPLSMIPIRTGGLTREISRYRLLPQGEPRQLELPRQEAIAGQELSRRPGFNDPA